MSDRLQEAASGAGPKKGFGGWIAGRANRKAYWLWMGPIFAALFVIGYIGIPGVELLFALPLTFTWIRRLHDLGRTGWWAPVINIVIGIVGWLEAGVMAPGGDGGVVQALAAVGALIALGSIPGQSGPNLFGPPPGKPSKLAETFS